MLRLHSTLQDDGFAILSITEGDTVIAELFARPSPYFLDNIYTLVNVSLHNTTDEQGILELLLVYAIEELEILHPDWQMPINSRMANIYSKLLGYRTPCGSKVKAHYIEIENNKLIMSSQPYFNLVKELPLMVDNNTNIYIRDFALIFYSKKDKCYPNQIWALKVLAGDGGNMPKVSWKSMMSQGLVKESHDSKYGYEITPLGYYFIATKSYCSANNSSSSN